MVMEGDGAGAGAVSVLRNHLPSQLGLWPELLCVVKVKWTVMDFESSNLHNLNAKRISTLDARFLFSTCASRVQCSVYYMSCLPGCSAVLLLAASLKLFKNETTTWSGHLEDCATFEWINLHLTRMSVGQVFCQLCIWANLIAANSH